MGFNSPPSFVALFVWPVTPDDSLHAKRHKLLPNGKKDSVARSSHAPRSLAACDSKPQEGAPLQYFFLWQWGN